MGPKTWVKDLREDPEKNPQMYARLGKPEGSRHHASSHGWASRVLMAITPKIPKTKMLVFTQGEHFRNHESDLMNSPERLRLARIHLKIQANNLFCPNLRETHMSWPQNPIFAFLGLE